MKRWTTRIDAIVDDTMLPYHFCGPIIFAPSWELAQAYCDLNGLGYCKVDGELSEEVPCDDEFNPYWDKLIDYDLINMN